ncbi:MAG: serine/threonine protein kinase, partial [Planctomycetota bacterium]
PKPFLEAAVQLGYLDTQEAQRIYYYYQNLMQQGKKYTIAQITYSKGLLTEYQIQEIEKSITQKLAAYKTNIKSSFSQIGIPGYQFIRKIGEGGMGTVYEGVQTSLDRKVAIKILSPKLVQSREYIERIGREAKTLARLNHPNIVQAYDFGYQNGLYYLVMEYVDGESLDEAIHRGERFEPLEALHIVIQVAQALKEAYRNKLLHRDIKPANIMRTKQGEVKLCDLGLAKEMDLKDQREMTSTSQAMGTPVYMSPEQCRGDQDIDIRSDIYSLGATFYHLVTGERPFDAPGIGGIFAQILSNHVPNAKIANPKVSFAMAKMISRMMAKDRDKRPQNPEQLIEELEKVQKAERVRSSTTSRGHSSTLTCSRITQKGKAFSSTTQIVPAVQKQRDAFLIILFLGLAIITGAFLFYLVSSSTSKEVPKDQQISSGTDSTHGTGSGKDAPSGTGTVTPPPKPVLSPSLLKAIAEMKGDISKNKYLAPLDRMEVLRKQYSKTSLIKLLEEKFQEMEKMILQSLEEEENKILAQPTKNLDSLRRQLSLYKSLINLGSPNFKNKLDNHLEKISLALKKAEQEKVKSKPLPYMSQRNQVMKYVRVWDFDRARKEIRKVLPSIPAANQNIFQKLLLGWIQNAEAGYYWMLKVAQLLARNRTPIPIKVKFEKDGKRTISWKPVIK